MQTTVNDELQRPGATTNSAGQGRHVRGRDQAVRLQAFAYHAAMSLQAACTDPETGKVVMDVKTAVAVHKLIGAWDTARDALRVLRGRGLPASIKSRAARSTAQVEPLEPA